VAQAYGVSLPQICRIIKPVQKWLVRQRAFDDDVGAKESLWLANHRFVAICQALGKRAIGPSVSINRSTDGKS
jgi:hypothetical protein